MGEGPKSRDSLGSSLNGEGSVKAIVVRVRESEFPQIRESHRIFIVYQIKSDQTPWPRDSAGKRIDQFQIHSMLPVGCRDIYVSWKVNKPSKDVIGSPKIPDSGGITVCKICSQKRSSHAVFRLN